MIDSPILSTSLQNLNYRRGELRKERQIAGERKQSRPCDPTGCLSSRTRLRIYSHLVQAGPKYFGLGLARRMGLASVFELPASL